QHAQHQPQPAEMVGTVDAEPAPPLRGWQEAPVLVHPHVADGGAGRPGQLVDGHQLVVGHGSGHGQSGKVTPRAAARSATTSGNTLRTRYRSRNIGQSGANSLE